MTLAGQGKSINQPSSRLTVRRFGKYLRQRRREAGLSLRTLGKKANVPFNTLSQVEHAIIEPRLWMVEALARGLGETPLDLLEGFYNHHGR